MTTARHKTEISSSDLDEFAAEVTSDIWNRLIETQAFHSLQLHDYPGLYETVLAVLRRYQRGDSSNGRK